MTLADHHYAMLHTGSALTDEVIKTRGYTSMDHPGEVQDLGFSKAQARTAPVLAIPLWDVHGHQSGWQIRPDSPRQMKDGKVFKYESPKKGRLQLDVHPSVQPLLGDPHIPLWITEGVKKGDALVSAGACAIALMGGVWGFRGTNAHGGKVILPDWEHVALNGRTVYVAYDSDLATKPGVDAALKALWTFLRSKQAIPARVHWPDEYQQTKCGVDDFLADHKSLGDLLAMVPKVGPMPATAPQQQNGAAPSGTVTSPVSPEQQRFHVSERGVWYRPDVDAEGNQPPDVWVCDELRIEAATRDIDNDNHGNLLAFRDKHGHPQEWAMPLELLEDQREYRKVLRRLGLRINGSGPAPKAYLQLYLDIWHTDNIARCVDRVGWHNNAYVLPDTTLGDPGEERLVLQNLDRRSEGYRQSGTLDGWQQMIAAACVGNSRLLLAVSTAFAAPLLALLDEESGGLHFRGPSSSGKTTAVYAAATVWGEPSRLERWRATANALEGVALAHNDNLLCLDELKEIDPREAGGVAYMLANGAGKRRGQPYGGTRPRLTWRLLFLSTGEISLEHHIAEAGQRIHAGQEVRLVDVSADAGAGLGLFEQVHGYGTGQAFADHLKACTRQHYGHAGRAFVTMLAQDPEEHKAQLRECMTAFVKREVSADASGQVARVAQRFALIAAAGELATAGGLTGWPEGEAFAAAQRCFRDWLAQRGSAGNADEARALAQVHLYFENYGKSRFEPWREGDDGETCQRCHGTGKVGYSYLQGLCFTCQGAGKITPDHPAMRLIQVHAGWSKATDDGGTEFYVQKETFRQEIARGLDVQWLCRIMKAKGYLLPATSGKNIRSERVPGHPSTPVYRITAALLGAKAPVET
jgi:uncharacterized protein (DUF927 family)